jgi:hypothetical protein
MCPDAGVRRREESKKTILYNWSLSGGGQCIKPCHAVVDPKSMVNPLEGVVHV